MLLRQEAVYGTQSKLFPAITASIALGAERFRTCISTEPWIRVGNRLKKAFGWHRLSCPGPRDGRIPRADRPIDEQEIGGRIILGAHRRNVGGRDKL